MLEEERAEKMREILGGMIVMACALGAVPASAQLFLDFEDPETDTAITAPNPYHGTTWTNNSGFGSDLGIGDIDWYNSTYGASLATLSGDQFGWSNSGLDNIGVDLGGVFSADSLFLTPWFGFGPTSMQVDMYLNGGLVASVTNIPMVANQWTPVDLGDNIIDEIVFRNFGNSQWYLIENVTLNAVPSPGAMALLVLAGLAARRRRRA